MKTKIVSNSDEVTDFYNKEIPKVDSNKHQDGNFRNVFFERVMLRKYIFWGSNSENVLFERAILKMYFLKEQFLEIFW